MPILESIQEYTQGIYEWLPDNTGRAILNSSFYSFVASIIVTANVSTSFMMGGVAGLASLVSACTLPLLKRIFTLNYLEWYQDGAKKIFNLAIIQLFVYSLTPLRMHFIASLTLTIGMDLIFNGLDERPFNMASTYIVF